MTGAPGWQAGRSALMAVGSGCAAALDGIPLGIELAAGHLHALSAEELADRADRLFDLLTAGYRAARARHRSLRPPSAGATNSAPRRNACSGPACRCSPGRSASRPRRWPAPDDRLPTWPPVLAELVRKSIVT